ncbi:spore germination protein [Jeotgalibacillus haloalkalitolerans]|uniref:Spore germination protein n=1 Tax=Jeotgalibacillus haloalkalitolerans TaxID=3104292 RepID=A0ABU5KL21_9BACL|nr:spore germination protein [Jeotgalibacillus sp. HH7-29]MDZ5711933.1 spore germination protein [Jeotgalibacillus sp. HH7-29]
MKKDQKRFKKLNQINQCKSFNELIEQVNFSSGNSDDLATVILDYLDKKTAILYYESLVDTDKQSDLLEWISDMFWKTDEFPDTLDVKNQSSDISFSEAIKLLLNGDTVLITNDAGAWSITSVKSLKIFQRAIQEPKNEQIVRGSHTGFNENLIVNLNLIRSRLKSPHLIIKYFSIGSHSHRKTALIYLNDLADPMLVEEYTMRLNAVDVDVAFSVGHIEEFIEDSNYTPFPQFLNTEKPERTVANLMEGRIAFMMDGSPTALIAPVNFFSFYQSPDDYNGRFIVGTFYRLLRIASFLIALLLPALYIATISYHFEIIPEALTLPAKRAVENIPYPPLVEALILELTIELIREAGIRLPNPIGQTIGIVGGLVIGDAVVNAGFISNLMVIVVALTAISSFVVPSVEMNTTIRILRFPFMIIASLFGFLGVAAGLVILMIHLIKLESLTTPYLSPLAPFHVSGIKDTFIRIPAPQQNTRSADANPIQRKRFGKNRWWKHAKK